MDYLAALDYEHLDQGIFLTALARAISKQNPDGRRVLIHGDSAYTDRIMQSGVMREDAKIRSIQDLNHRLVALLADEGVSAIGINGFQRELIVQDDEKLSLDRDFFVNLPQSPLLVISTLVWDEATAAPQPVGLPRLISFLSRKLGVQSVFAFSIAEKDEIIVEEKPEELNWKELPSNFRNNNIPKEFHHFDKDLFLTTAREFSNVTALNRFLLLH